MNTALLDKLIKERETAITIVSLPVSGKQKAFYNKKIISLNEMIKLLGGEEDLRTRTNRLVEDLIRPI